MESVESKLFDLLERHSFDQLNGSQKKFVLQHMSEEEFRSQQKVMIESGLIEYPVVSPRPLILENDKKGILLMPIPLYKVLMGIAATILGVWFFWPKDANSSAELLVKTNTIYDTVYVAKIKYDTIRKYSEKILMAKNEKTPDTVYVYESNNKSNFVSQRMLEPAANQANLELDEKKLKTKGSSIKNDETMNLLPTVPAFGL